MHFVECRAGVPSDDPVPCNVIFSKRCHTLIRTRHEDRARWIDRHRRAEHRVPREEYSGNSCSIVGGDECYDFSRRCVNRLLHFRAHTAESFMK